MYMKFWGVRGSLLAPGPTTERYGGNTACVSVELANGPLLILDSGTGIRGLGQELGGRPGAQKLVLLLSHAHWDHIQGFPFFGPAYRSETEIEVMGCPVGTHRLKHVLSDVMERGHFPIPMDSLSARPRFHMLHEGWRRLGSARIRPIETCHPGGGRGFRIEEAARTLVYLTDNELPEDPVKRQRFVDVTRNANVLIHDAQYTAAELPGFRGWGHSSIEQAVELACEAGVESLYLFHHDPDRTDTELALLEDGARKLAASLSGTLQVFAAAEQDGRDV